MKTAHQLIVTGTAKSTDYLSFGTSLWWRKIRIVSSVSKNVVTRITYPPAPAADLPSPRPSAAGAPLPALPENLLRGWAGCPHYRQLPPSTKCRPTLHADLVQYNDGPRPRIELDEYRHFRRIVLAQRPANLPSPLPYVTCLSNKAIFLTK